MFARVFTTAALLLSLFARDAFAWTHGNAGVTAPNGIQMNLGTNDQGTSSGVVNFLKTAVVTYSGGATPGTAAVDANGYPTQSFTGDMSLALQPPIPAGPYTIIWTAGTKLRLLQNNASSSCSLAGTGGSITGCSNNNVTLTIDGSGAGSLTLTSSTISVFLQGAGSYGAAGTANLAIIQASNLSRYNDCVAASNAGCFTPGLMTVMEAGRYKHVRTLDWNQINFSRETKDAYRSRPDNLSWRTQYPLGAWSGGANSAGAITGTDIYSGAIATDQPVGAWVQGEVVMGAVANASSALITISGAADNGSGLCRLTVSSSATLTTGQQVWASNITATGGELIPGCNGEFVATVINGTQIDLQSSSFPGATTFSGTGYLGVQTLTITGKTGTKFIASLQGLPLRANSGNGVSAGIVTFSYDAVLDKIIATNGSYTTGFPFEATVSFANQLNANLWFLIPYMVEDAWVQSASTAALALKQGLYFMPEVTNEPWNTAFAQTVWAAMRGSAFGFPVGNSERTIGYYSLRTRQVMGGVIPPIWAARSQYLRPVMNFQAFGVTSQIKTYGLESADLAPIASGGKGNATYDTFTGSANYRAFPDRAGDKISVVSYAPYSSGTNLGDQGLNGGRTANANNAVQLQAWATAFDANPNDPTAIAELNNDQLQGVQRNQALTCPTGSTFTLSSHGFANTGTALYALVSATGGTVCIGLSSTQAYCFLNVATNTFQLGLPNTTTGDCQGSSAIAVSPGTGSVSIGAVSGTTPFVFNSTIYPKFENIAASYDAQRAGGGLLPYRVEWYEGSSQPVVPSAAALTTLGVTVAGTGAAANTALTNGVTAWRQNVISYSFIQTYYNYFMAFSHSKTPSQLALFGVYSSTNPYAFVGNSQPDISSAYQTFYGAAAMQTPN